MNDLRHLIIELLPNATHKKRDTFEQALDVRVASAVRKHRRKGRIRSGELPPKLAQIYELVLKILVEH